MKLALITLLAAIFTMSQCLAADDSAEKTISRSFAVEPGGEISIDADRGDITISTGSQNNVEVIVEREVRGVSERKETSVLKSHKVAIVQDGNNVRVQAALAKSRSQPNLSVRFRVTVPKRFNASLNTAGGSIQVSDLHGNVDARTSGGDLKFSKIEGPIDAHTSGGNVTAAGCTDKLQVQTSGGNIAIKDFSGPSATADTSGGSVNVITCSGAVQIKTSGGDITVDKFSGPSVFADTSGGAMTFNVEKQPAADCWFRTGGGNITVRLPENIAMNVIASTDGGEVNTAIPVNATVQGRVKEGRLEGKINGGGPKLALKTSGGDIHILKQ